MGRPSCKDKILTEGLRVVHERGFSNASVRDIMHAAGGALGSFNNHFTSKEAFGLEVLNLYFESGRERTREILLDESVMPLERLRNYIDTATSALYGGGEWNGCLIGNMSADVNEHSELIRQRIVEIFAELRQDFADCLQAAVKAGELPESTDSDDLAGFIMSSLQGAHLEAKAEHSMEPIERFKRVMFGTILR